MNLEFPDLVCDHMMDKALHSINCGDVADRQESLISGLVNFTSSTMPTFTNPNDTQNNIEFNSTNHDFEMEVCRAERESQKLGSTISAYIAPFGIMSHISEMHLIMCNKFLDSTIGIILVLFAGSWSDKTGRRKPTILIPQLGECLGQFGKKNFHIFQTEINFQFHVFSRFNFCYFYETTSC